ncbi:MAG TPA: acyl-CoA dehydrogenase family protein, partial [Caulobacteraceae bacterium]|nr:acyl-CoA dehydrogenase family protein [Caulobacteraceae bacterium]
MADFGGEVEAFRGEARAWLEENFPPALKKDPAAQMAAMMGGPESADVKLWRGRMGAKGWGTPTWPKAYGGGGLSRAEARVLAEEMARIGARNPIGGMGVMMFGPTLIEVGTEAQKQRHIPPIVKGELRWCQGYSEPGSGSDLASLQTKAEDKGDHWLVNGQKIWTSGANLADWCFCLVRTDPTKKHEGISFLLIDMKTPGVEPRPIRLINDTTPFCETFFTDAKAPKANLVGPLNGGWTIAKRLLQFERQGIGSAQRAGQGGPGVLAGPPVNELAKAYVGTDEAGRLADADLR